MYCYVRDCPNGPKSLLKKKKDSDLTKFFPAPEDKTLLEKWRRIVPKGENLLCPKDQLCDSHFLPSEVLWFTETKLPNGNVRRLLRDEPILRPGTIPSIFPAERLEKENVTLTVKERQETPKPIVKNVPSIVKEKTATPKSIVKNTNVAVKEKIEGPKSNFRIRFKDQVESSGKRNPQRVKRRSTVLDDYWTDDELTQVHNPAGTPRGAAGSMKKRKTESSGLQPVIRLVPLECLMDKTVSKSKTPCKPVVGNRPSTEEIDLELKKVIEIPLLTSLKPNKSLNVRSTKETVQFKPPKKNVSKSKMKIMVHSEALVPHDQVAANSSEGFNEVKTETPDIEEELARMEMEEENEDVKSSDIVVMNPPLLEDDSVVVKSEEEDDGYNINEGTVIPPPNVPEGDEVPTIKSESEEEQPAVEVGSNSTSDNDFAVESQPISVAENGAAAGSEQEPSLPIENNDSASAIPVQPNELPEVPSEAEQNKDEESRASEGELVENTTAVEAEVPDNSSSNKETEEGDEIKVGEEKGPEEVVDNQEKEKTPEESGKEGDVEIPAVTVSEEVNTGEVQDDLASDQVQAGEKDFQDSQVVEPDRKDNESVMEIEPSQEVESEIKEGESAVEIEKETPLHENIEEAAKVVENEEMPKHVENEEMPKLVENEEMPKLVENEEMSKLVENETSQGAEEETKEATENEKECGATVEETETEMVETSEPSGAELEKDLNEDKERVNEDESRSNNDLREAGIETDGGSMNETDKGENETVITVNDDSPKEPDNNVIEDVSDSEGIEADEDPVTEVHQEADSVIDVDFSDAADQSSNDKDPPAEQSSSSREVEPERKDDQSTMETEHGDDPAVVQIADDIADDDIQLCESPVADDEAVEAEKDVESEKRDSKPAEQMENDEEMDIEAEVARLVSEVGETVVESPNKKVENEADKGNTSNSSQPKGKQADKDSAAKESSQPQEIVLQDTTNLGGITAAGVQNLFSPETIQEILKQIKLPLTTPVTFRIAPLADTPTSSSSSGRGGRGRKKGMRGMRGTNRPVVPRASSSREASHDSIDLFRHLTRTRTVFDFPTFVPDIDDDIQYWKLCQILKESFHELIETRNTKTSIGKLTLRVSLNRPKKPKVQQNNGESEADP
ncbi:enolase-phosphatase E1 [Halyomorpha halys]|uniref:enolase-phosphatase E1 n=1 Tax=Halyomorpha halys TaxID=286706 RepID=UPI0006D50ED9